MRADHSSFADLEAAASARGLTVVSGPVVASAREVEEYKLRQQYDYLFTYERTELKSRAETAERLLREQTLSLQSARISISNLSRTVREMEEKHAAEVEKLKRAKAARSKNGGQGYNRVIFWVTANFNGPAQAVLDHLLAERRKNGDDPELGQKIAVGSAEGHVLKLVVDYTVHGGWPADVKDLLKDTARKIGGGLSLLDIESVEKSRQSLTCPKGCCVAPVVEDEPAATEVEVDPVRGADEDQAEEVEFCPDCAEEVTYGDEHWDGDAEVYVCAGQSTEATQTGPNRPVD